MPANLRSKRPSQTKEINPPKMPLQRKRNSDDNLPGLVKAKRPSRERKVLYPKEDLNNEIAKESLSQYLVDDFLPKQQQALTPVIEAPIQPTQASQESATLSNQYNCNVSNSLTNEQWSGFAKVKVTTGTNDLICWRLYSSINNSECYVFATEFGGSLRYITFQGEGEPFRFETSSVHPTSIDMDNGGEKNDPRAFYWRPDGSSGHLVLALDEDLAARLDSSRGQVVADVRDAWTDSWYLNYWA